MMSEENRRLMMSGQGEVALRAWKTAYYRKAGASSSRCRLNPKGTPPLGARNTGHL